MERLHKIVDRIQSWAGLWSLVQGSGILSVGIVAAWAASATDAISAYGTFGWLMAGLLGAALAALILVLASWFRYWLACAAAIRSWKKRTSHDVINPMDVEFVKKQIKLSDIINPITRRISRKKFTNCELIGPCNVCLVGADIYRSRFIDCDIVVAKEGSFWRNAVIVENSSIIDSVLGNITIILQPDMVDTFGNMGAEFLTLTGHSKFDSQRPRNTAAQKQP